MRRDLQGPLGAACLIAALAAFFLGNRLSAAAPEAAPGVASLLAALSARSLAALPAAIAADPLRVSAESADVLCGLVCACAPLLLWGAAASAPRPQRTADAYGSERLGKARDLAGYRNRASFADNLILSRRCLVSTGGGARKRTRNLNTCVVGGSGAGKTTSFLEPNLLQVALGARKDVVFSDPKDATMGRVGARLVEAGCVLVQLNLVDLERSAVWNPLAIIRTYTDVERVANALVLGANAGGRSTSEPIWDNGAASLAAILISYLRFWRDPADLTMKGVQTMLGACDFSSPRCGFDALVDELRTGWAPSGETAPAGEGGLVESRAPMAPSRLRRHAPGDPPEGVPAGAQLGFDYTVASWDRFRAGATETLGSFKATLNQAIRVFCTPEVMRALGADSAGRDEVGLDLLGLGEKPRVVGVVASDRDHALQPVLALFFWEAMYCAGRNADALPGKRLPRHVQFLVDELYALGDLPDFAENLVTVRSRNASVAFCVQSLSQLKARFGEEGLDNIRDSCAVTVYLAGSRNAATARQLSEEIGQATVVKDSESLRGKGLLPGKEVSQDVVGRPVLTPQEIGRLGGAEGDAALLLVGGEYAVVDRKYRLEDHPAYDPLAMFDPGGPWPDGHRLFDYGAYLEGQRKGEGVIQEGV